MADKNYLGRETVEPPRWMGALMSADAKKALLAGLLVILVMPSDIIMLTVGVNLVQNNAGLIAALPFIAATVLVAALPPLLYLLFIKTHTATDAEATRLDERQQLAGEHNRLRRVHHPYPLRSLLKRRPLFYIQLGRGRRFSEVRDNPQNQRQLEDSLRIIRFWVSLEAGRE